MEGVALNRLKWKCRRGLLELDLVLRKFIQECLQEEDISMLNELLELDDSELWDIVSGRSERYEQRFGGIVARLRAV